MTEFNDEFSTPFEDEALFDFETSQNPFLGEDEIDSPFAEETPLFDELYDAEHSHEQSVFEGFTDDDTYTSESDAYHPQDFVDDEEFEYGYQDEFYEEYTDDTHDTYTSELDAYHPQDFVDDEEFEVYSNLYVENETVTDERWNPSIEIRRLSETISVRRNGGMPYDDGKNCSGTFTEGARVLCHYIGNNFSGVSHIGGYSCRPNTHPNSRDEVSIHGLGRALDIHIPEINNKANSSVGDPIAHWLIRNAENIGIQYIIWNRVSWGGYRGTSKFRPYTGRPHTDHIHMELNNEGANRRTPWFAGRPVPNIGSGRCYDNPTVININRAIRKNRSLSRELGWYSYRDSISRFFGFNNVTPSESAFAQAVANWQNKNGLTTDGIIGKNTWKILQKHIANTATSSTNRSSRSINIKRAIQLNRRYRKELGWGNHEFAIQRLLGFTNMSPTEDTFAQAVADWQQSNGLSTDGIIGPNTWARIEPLLTSESVSEVFEGEYFDDELRDEELERDSEVASSVTFPSGQSLQVVTGSDGKGQEYYDPNHSGNPLLDTSSSQQSKRLSKNFTVGEFARSGARRFDRARIDPRLVQYLQMLRDYIGKPINVNSGYRSYNHNKKVNGAKTSQHMSGRAADIRVSGMRGLDLAKAAIDVCGCNISIGVGETYIHIDVRLGSAKFWGYGRNKYQLERSIEAYYRSKCGQ